MGKSIKIATYHLQEIKFSRHRKSPAWVSKFINWQSIRYSWNPSASSSKISELVLCVEQPFIWYLKVCRSSKKNQKSTNSRCLLLQKRLLRASVRRKVSVPLHDSSIANGKETYPSEQSLIACWAPLANESTTGECYREEFYWHPIRTRRVSKFRGAEYLWHIACWDWNRFQISNITSELFKYEAWKLKQYPNKTSRIVVEGKWGQSIESTE